MNEKEHDWFLASERAKTAAWRDAAMKMANAFGWAERLWDEDSSEAWNNASKADRKAAMDAVRRLIDHERGTGTTPDAQPGG